MPQALLPYAPCYTCPELVEGCPLPIGKAIDLLPPHSGILDWPIGPGFLARTNELTGRIMGVNARDHGESIRSATENDFDQVMEIDRFSFSAPWIYNFFKSALKDIFLVLEKEGEIIGYLIACVCHDLEKAVILRIAVHPSHRSKGAAGILIRTCLDLLVQKDIGVVELDVELISRGAIRLYEKFGFKIANVIVFPSDFPGDEETFYIMRRELP